jgi:SulP family sulfate permease
LRKQNIIPFEFSFSELSGSVADLGVMLPLILALITLNGMDATAVFVGIGFAYILVAIVYRLPIPVQPLKSISSLALALGLSPILIVTGAIWNALAFLGLGLSGTDRWIQKAFPKPIIRGIQIGLSWLLIKSAWNLISLPTDPWRGVMIIFNRSIPWVWILVVGSAISLMVLNVWKKEYAALGVVVFGVGITVFRLGLPQISFQLTLPELFPLIPNWDQLWQGLVLLALPQIPLSLGNSVYATGDAARTYFGKKAGKVTERKLMLTMSAIDGMTAMLGGIPLCHGSGGLTAHYRLGARTGGAPLMIGSIFLVLGLFGGEASMSISGLVPLPVLGVLLVYVGAQHLLLAQDLTGIQEWSSALLVFVVTIITSNLAIGFLCGAIIYHSWKWLAQKQLVRFEKIRG